MHQRPTSSRRSGPKARVMALRRPDVRPLIATGMLLALLLALLLISP